jgi:hypothetical protein
MIEEIWSSIPGFSGYSVSNFGRVHHNRRNRIMSASFSNWGHLKISLVSDMGQRQTKLVAPLVAEAFVEPPTNYSDHVILLDGDYSNVSAWNLAWRPKGFAWSYVHQLKTKHPTYYRSLAVQNVSHKAEYNSIIEAGMTEGLLFDDIWRSTYTGDRIFPYRSIFRVIERV